MNDAQVSATAPSALKCYGDFFDIQKKLRVLIASKLAHVPCDGRRRLQELVHLRDDEFLALSEQREDFFIDSSLFERLACPLKLFMASAFGPAKTDRLNADVRRYFEQRMQEDGFALAAPDGFEPAKPDDGQGGRNKNENLLELYLYFVAVEEMDELVARRKSAKK